MCESFLERWFLRALATMGLIGLFGLLITPISIVYVEYVDLKYMEEVHETIRLEMVAEYSDASVLVKCSGTETEQLCSVLLSNNQLFSKDCTVFSSERVLCE